MLPLWFTGGGKLSSGPTTAACAATPPAIPAAASKAAAAPAPRSSPPPPRSKTPPPAGFFSSSNYGSWRVSNSQETEDGGSGLTSGAHTKNSINLSSLDEIKTVEGVEEKVAKKIYNFFHE